MTKLEDYCDELFKSPSNETMLIQEFHTIVGHEICLEVEKELFLIKNEY